jgi:hypothetical protein
MEGSKTIFANFYILNISPLCLHVSSHVFKILDFQKAKCHRPQHHGDAFEVIWTTMCCVGYIPSTLSFPATVRPC